MNEAERSLRNWILNQHNPGYVLQEVSETELHLDTDYATASILFYIDPDIVEFTITMKETGEVVFYLHFQPDNPVHGEELFHDLVHSLITLKEHQEVQILLCCTSGLTTSYFASQLNDAASVLKLNYVFSAVSYEELFEKEYHSELILLAPQISFQYEAVKEALPDTRVLKIPTELFARYDASALIDLIKETLKQKEEPAEPVLEEPSIQKDACFNKHHILLINIRIRERSSFRYRVYENGLITLDETVMKYRQALTLPDIEDIITTVIARGHQIDLIGISAPGTIHEGHIFLPEFTSLQVDLDIPAWLEEKYHIQACVLNNMNAAALGCYYCQNQFHDIVLLYQSAKHISGGAGIIINGQLVTGLNSMAGETKYLAGCLVSHSPYDSHIHSAREAEEIVTRTICSIQSVIGTQAVYLCSPLTPNLKQLHNDLAKRMDEKYIPAIIKVNDLCEPIFYGILLYTLGLTQKA